MMMERQGQPVSTNMKFPTHDLPSDTKTINESGLTNEVSVPMCSTCHQVIGDRFYLCHHCNRVLCDKPSCAIMYLNKAHCEHDLRRFHFDISERDYLVLSCFVNDLKDTETIGGLTLSAEDVERSLARLLNSNLIVQETRFLGVINDLKVTDTGMTALTTYRHVYGTSEDVAIFGKVLRKKGQNESLECCWACRIRTCALPETNRILPERTGLFSHR